MAEKPQEASSCGSKTLTLTKEDDTKDNKDNTSEATVKLKLQKKASTESRCVSVFPI